MKIFRSLATLVIISAAIVTYISSSLAQTAIDNNNNNQNVDIDIQDIGSGSQQQRANGGNSEVNVTEEDAEDNFFTNSYRGFITVPAGSASVACEKQLVSFARTGGFGFGVGAAGVSFSDNSGKSPEELQQNLAAIRQCAKDRNTAQIMDKYLQLFQLNRAVANTYLRVVSPELYATFFLENAKISGEIKSPETYLNLTGNLRDGNFEKVVEWQDYFYSTNLEAERIKFKNSQELRSSELQKQLVELEVLELQRKAREIEAIVKQKQQILQP